MKKALPFIILLGLILRLVGIQFGLPHITHADEPIIVNHALAYGGGDRNPHFFKIPPLISYILFVVYAIYFLAGKLIGLFPDAHAYLEAFLINPASWYLIGRLFIGVIIGTCSIPILYLLAKKLYGRRTALLASLFFSVSFIHVLHSHYIYVDIPLVAVVMVVAYVSILVYEEPTYRNYACAGALVGLASAVKYNGLLTCLFVIAAHFIGRERRSFIKPIISVIACAAIFIACNPFMITDFKFAYTELINQSKAMGPLGWWHHFRYSLVEGVGWPLALAGMMGAALSLLRRDRRALIAVSFPIVFFISLSFFSQPHERYVLPVVPFVCIYAAWLFEDLCQKMPTRRLMIGVITTIFIILPNIAKDVRLDRLASRLDTRSLAKSWIELNIPPGSRIALDHSFFCPRLWPTKEQLRDKLRMASLEGQKMKASVLIDTSAYPRKNYELYYVHKKSDVPTDFLFSQPLISESIDSFREKRIEYLVVHRDICGQTPSPVFKELIDHGTLLAEFSPYSGDKSCSNVRVVETGLPFFESELLLRIRPGYYIAIYKVNKAT